LVRRHVHALEEDVVAEGFAQVVDDEERHQKQLSASYHRCGGSDSGSVTHACLLAVCGRVPTPQCRGHRVAGYTSLTFAAQRPQPAEVVSSKSSSHTAFGGSKD
jgi:hypothetical protein